ncbi:MAG: hypothetical protein CK425_04310 [Parachlamydia sp.]|nr:MAG: hypothetical protein CK425_04310 [Parachlamydia sp.]
MNVSWATYAKYYYNADWTQGVPPNPHSPSGEKKSVAQRIKDISIFLADAPPENLVVKKIIKRCWRETEKLTNPVDIIEADLACIHLPIQNLRIDPLVLTFPDSTQQIQQALILVQKLDPNSVHCRQDILTIAQLLKDTSPFDPIVSKSVDLCWKAAEASTSGFKMIELLTACCELPKTAKYEEMTAPFAFKIEDRQLALRRY